MPHISYTHTRIRANCLPQQIAVHTVCGLSILFLYIFFGTIKLMFNSKHCLDEVDGNDKFERFT